MLFRSEQKEIAILKKELHDLTENGPKAKQIRAFYKNKLVEFGAMKQFKNRCRTLEEDTQYIKKSK